MSGRFQEWHNVEAKHPTPPWAIAKDEIPWMESILPLIKTPSTWPSVRRFFSDLGHMKTSETILFAGDVGAYFLRHMEIDDDYRELFIRLVRVTERLSHAHTHTYTYTRTRTRTDVVRHTYVVHSTSSCRTSSF
jgi:hypothetical protein